MDLIKWCEMYVKASFEHDRLMKEFDVKYKPEYDDLEERFKEALLVYQRWFPNKES